MRRLLLLWALGAALVLGLGTVGYVWKGRQASIAQLERSTETIALGIAAACNRALGYGFPLERWVQVEAWLKDKQQDLPMVRGMALLGESGQLLFASGERPDPQAIQIALSAKTSVSKWRDGAKLYAFVPLRAEVAGSSGASVQGYFAVSSALLWPHWHGAAALLVAALIFLALAGLAWRSYVKDRLQLPQSQAQRVAEALVEQASSTSGWGSWASTPERQPSWHLSSALVAPWRRALKHLQARHTAILTKAQDVRASHFDPAVIARIDALVDSVTLRSAPHNATEVSRSLIRTLSLRNSLAAASTLTLALMLGGVWAMAQWQRSTQGDVLAEQQQQIWQARWQAFVQEAQAPIRAQGQALLMSPELESWLTQHAPKPLDADAPSQQLRDEASSALLVLDASAELLGRSNGSAGSAVNRRSLELLGTVSESRGVWLGSDRRLHLGTVWKAARSDGAPVWIIASQPVEALAKRFATSAGQGIALADLRGQAIGADERGWIALWREHGERSLRLPQRFFGGSGHRDDAQLLSAWPLVGLDGRSLGTAVALAPIDARLLHVESRLPWWVAGLVLVLFVVSLSYVGRVVNLWARGVRRVQELRGSEARRGADPLKIASLEEATQAVGEELAALHALKRSRERQGKRQARFMRHQMMSLAQRLDEGAREGVLQDLAKIEAASKEVMPATPVVDTSAVVDEVSVLALGFQNLVGRVGDQYAQLERLIVELRAALQAKTQLIAIQQELEIASKMQLSMLPTIAPDVAGVEVGAIMHAAKEVGGDFYDYFRLDEHRIALAVGDVSGKGVPAAFFMAVSRTLLRALAQIHESPAECLAKLNDLLEADNKEMMFVTLFYAVFDARSGQLTYANGGHNPPYVLHADGRIEEIGSLGDMALAVMGGMPYSEAQVTLLPGDGFFAFTDGVTEATSPEQALYGEERLEPMLRDRAALSIQQRTDELLASLRAFEGPGNQADDITMLVMQYKANKHG